MNDVTVPFLIDDTRVQQLAATRQGRTSLGGFAYQTGYAVARLASMYARQEILGLSSFPVALRFDWAEDLDEVDDGGRTILSQCKRVDNIGQAAKLSEVFLGFAPKYLWTPAEKRAQVRFRLVCTDARFSRRGPVDLKDYRSDPKESTKADVKSAFLAELSRKPGNDAADRSLWQESAEQLGAIQLFDALWEQTEVLYLPSAPARNKERGVMFEAEREALDLLLRGQLLFPARQSEAIQKLRWLIHSDVVEFDPTSHQKVAQASRKPRVLLPNDVRNELCALGLPVEQSPPFQIVTYHLLEEAAAKERKPYVARQPDWADVVHGEDKTVKFLEREQTGALLTKVYELIENIGADKPLPALFVIGGPGAGKTTLVRRVAARIVQQRRAVVAAPKLNLDSIEQDEVASFIDALHRVAAGDLPVLLVLDDPFFARSGWPGDTMAGR